MSIPDYIFYCYVDLVLSIFSRYCASGWYMGDGFATILFSNGKLIARMAC